MIFELMSFDHYSSHLKRNIALIKTLLEFAAELSSGSAKQVSKLLSQLLQQNSIESIAEKGDTFLWHNILLSIANSEQAGELERYLNYILVHLFDNYYDYISDGNEISVSLPQGICLPKLNIVYKHADASNNLLTIKKLSKDAAQLSIGRSTFTMPLRDNCSKYENIYLINLDHAALCILLANFLPNSEVEKMCTLDQGWVSKITTSLDIIKMVDKNLFNSISKNLHYIIPLTLYQEQIRTSFSTAELGSVIFISDGGTLLDFCEALIHEYYHNELNALLEFKSLFISGVGNVFYSPWREDLRPIGGLVHAIYVFVGVIQFYSQVLNGHHLSDDVRAHRDSIANKVKLAFQQVDENSLTIKGKELVIKLYQKFLGLVSEGGIQLGLDQAQLAIVKSGHAEANLPKFLADVQSLQPESGVLALSS
jgi:HEXXH motif-containing protein